MGGTEIARPPKDLLDSPEHFPWIPRTLEQIMCGLPLERCSGGKTDAESNEGAVSYADLPQTCITAFYFAAHWCPPCKAFTPQLAETYSIIRRRGHDFRIIFVSSDRSEESYQISCSGMPWLSVGFSGSGGERARRELALALRVQGIPALRIFPLSGAAPVDARHQVVGDPDGLNFPWKPGPVSVLTEHFLIKMQEHPAIVLFVDGEESEIQFAESVLLPAAGSYFDEYSIRHPGFCPYQETSPDEESIDFEYPSFSGAVAPIRRKRSGRLQFLIAIDADASDALREQTGADDAVPLLTAIDFPGGRMAVMKYGEEITTDSVQNFLDSYLSGQLEFKSLPRLLPQDEPPKEDLS